jgi:hypothetical protein
MGRRRPHMLFTPNERRLLEKLADEGKATPLLGDELEVAKFLEGSGLIFRIRDTLDAIITPKGRHALAGNEIVARSDKKPRFGFTDR